MAGKVLRSGQEGEGTWWVTHLKKETRQLAPLTTTRGVVWKGDEGTRYCLSIHPIALTANCSFREAAIGVQFFLLVEESDALRLALFLPEEEWLRE